MAVYPPRLGGPTQFGSTLQNTSKAFVLKKLSSDNPPYLFLLVHPPCLVVSPYFGSTHQDTGRNFGLKRITFDNPPALEKGFQTALKVKGAYYAFFKNYLSHMTTLATLGSSVPIFLHHFYLTMGNGNSVASE